MQQADEEAQGAPSALRSSEPAAKRSDTQKSPRARLAERLFDVSPSDTEYPGIHLFMEQLQERREDFKKFPAQLWTSLGWSESDPDLWEWYNVVAGAFCDLQEKNNRDPSMKDLVTAITKRGSKSSNRARDEASVPDGRVGQHSEGPEKVLVAHAALTTLNWLSTAGVPGLAAIPSMNEGPSTEKDRFTLAWGDPESDGRCTIKLSDRVSAVFRDFQNTHRFSNPPREEDDVLHEASLTYESLYKFGGVQLKWVDNLRDHLAFDRADRSLSVYRFPSICAAKAMKPNAFSVDNIITNWVLSHKEIKDKAGIDDRTDVYREVLLSYRLLFGQNTKSRKLLEKELNQEQSARKMAVDPLLRRCTEVISKQGLFSKWVRNVAPPFNFEILPSSVRDANNMIREWPTYSAKFNFPVFGRRLQELQEYGDIHPPVRLSEYLLDRRFPRQMYASRVAIIIAVLPMLLSIVQIILASIQLNKTSHER